MCRTPLANALLHGLLCVALLAAARPSAAWDENALRRGEILLELEEPDDGGWARAHAAAAIDCPPERVWRILNDYDNLQDVIPGIAQSEIRSREGDVIYYYEVTHVPILKDPWYVLRCVHDEDALSKTMTLVEGTMDALEASWSLRTSPDGGTLAEYHLLSDPGYSVPVWIQKRILGKTVRGFLQGLRDACATGHGAGASPR